MERRISSARLDNRRSLNFHFSRSLIHNTLSLMKTNSSSATARLTNILVLIGVFAFTTAAITFAGDKKGAMRSISGAPLVAAVGPTLLHFQGNTEDPPVAPGAANCTGVACAASFSLWAAWEGWKRRSAANAMRQAFTCSIRRPVSTTDHF